MDLEATMAKGDMFSRYQPDAVQFTAMAVH